MSTPSEILAKWREADEKMVDDYNCGDHGFGIEARLDITTRRLLGAAAALSLLLKHLAENESKDAA